MDNSQDRLELDSQLTELSRVRPWIESQANRHGFDQDALFAMRLCIEEALANVVLHGYRNEPGHPIAIQASVSAGILSFAIDDQAPPFSPVEPGPRDPAAQCTTLESMEPGGNGIRLLHRFAGSLAYERLYDSNRLTIGFPVPVRDLSG
jgi:anti-sigma regulatory factor (Ser/Thr protein kinase)